MFDMAASSLIFAGVLVYITAYCIEFVFVHDHCNHYYTSIIMTLLAAFIILNLAIFIFIRGLKQKIIFSNEQDFNFHRTTSTSLNNFISQTARISDMACEPTINISEDRRNHSYVNLIMWSGLGTFSVEVFVGFMKINQDFRENISSGYISNLYLNYTDMAGMLIITDQRQIIGKYPNFSIPSKD